MIKCNKCLEVKEEKEYYPRNKVCKECTKKRVSEYQKTEKGREVRRNANKRYSSTDKGKYVLKLAEEKYKLLPSTKKKLLAKWAVKRAIKIGVLKKEPCLECGRIKVHGHHPDYDKQLDVIWLCAEHHYAWHAMYGEGKNAN